MPLDAQRHGLDALQQQERAQRRQRGAGGAQTEIADAFDISGRAEMLDIDQPVIGLIRLVEHREARGRAVPREAAAIDDDAAQGRAVAAQEFRHRFDDDVGAELDRPQQHRRGNRIVDDQRHALRMRDGGQIASMSQILPAGLPTVSQKTAIVFSSISFAISSAWSEAAKRAVTPMRGRT